MLFLGIDPGKKGALALFDPSTQELNLVDMPVSKRVNSKKGTETNYALLAQVMRPPEGVLIHCVMEQVWSMPKEGVSSAHEFGRNNGALLTALAIYEIPYQLVTAAKWKKHFGLSQDKGASTTLAVRHFPKHRDQFYGPRGGILDGRAEAALLALYATQTNTHLAA